VSSFHSDGSGKKIVGRFGLLGQLFKSAFGQLWMGRVESGEDEGSFVAIRMVASGAPASVGKEDLASIAEAARAATKLRHEGIVSVLDVTESGADLGIVSAYLPGDCLRSVALRTNTSRKPMPPSVALRIALDLADGMRFLHEDGSVGEADVLGLTADTVWLATDGRARILEPVVGSAVAGVSAWARHPKSACYEAPERLSEGAEVDERADVFSLGVLMWEMLRNRPLFAGSTYKAVAQRVKESAIQRADALKPAGGQPIPKELATVVAKALERDPAARYASAAEMATALKDTGVPVATDAEVAAFVEQTAADTFTKQRRRVEQAGGARSGARGCDGRAARPQAVRAGHRRSARELPG